MKHENSEKPVTLREFLLYHTQCYELCVVRLDGWIVATFWIDDEDLFAKYISQELANKVVQSDCWKDFPSVDYAGSKRFFPAHFIDI